MTGVCHSDAAGEVEQFASIIRVDVGAFSAFRNKIENARPRRGHVREILGVEGADCHSFLFSKHRWLSRQEQSECRIETTEQKEDF
jgi:hypothetical protein